MPEARLEPCGDGCYRVIGRLTFATVPALEGAVDGADDAPALSFDLSGVEHADSAGVALIVAWARAARRKGKVIGFLNVPAQMQAVARVSGLERLLPEMFSS